MIRPRHADRLLCVSHKSNLCLSHQVMMKNTYLKGTIANETLIWRLPWQQIAGFYTRRILVYYSVTTDVSAKSRNGLMVTQGLKLGCIIQCLQTTWVRCWRYAHSQVHKISLFKLNFVRACLDIECFQERVDILSKIACFMIYQMTKIP